jgi:hypothetical protein
MNHEQDDHRLISPSSGLSRDLITGGSSKRWIQFSIWNRLCGGNQSHPTSFPIGGIYFPEWALMMISTRLSTSFARKIFTGYGFHFICISVCNFSSFNRPGCRKVVCGASKWQLSIRGFMLWCHEALAGLGTPCAVKALPFRPACLGDDVRLWFWWLFWGVDLLYADNILVCCRCWL